VPSFQLRSAGYGLLSIGVVNLLLTGSLAPQLFNSAPGRLTMANSLIAFAPWLLLSLALIFLQGNRQRLSQEPLPMLLLHRLLLPIALGYLLLVPLMVRDGLGVNRSVQGQIGQEVRRFRTASERLLAEVRPLTTPLAVARTLERYPNISIAIDPGDNAAQVKAKLAEALANGQARLENRLDEVRQSRLEGLFQRTLGAALVAVITATGLGALRRQNLDAIRQSGSEANLYFTRDLRRQGLAVSGPSRHSEALQDSAQSSG
jgi:hypothetical protein